MLPRMKTVLLATKQEREKLLDALARGLEPGESLVQVIDTYRMSGKITLQIPQDAGAEVVATEPPRLQPGGITELVAYVRVKDRSIREVTFLGDEVERDVELALRAARKPMA
ncbi:MAG: hypothetical protein ACYDDF_08830 [Thermoplasmatota archaeon]